MKQAFHFALLVAAAVALPACTVTTRIIACNQLASASCCPGNALCVASGSVYVAARNQILHFSLDPSTGVLTPSASVTTANPVGGVLSPFGSNFVYAIDAAQSAIVGYSVAGTSFRAVPGSPFSGIDGQARPASDGTFLFMPGSSGQGLGVFSIGPQGGLTFLNPVPGVPPSTTPFFAAVAPLVPRFVYSSNVAAVPGEIDAAAVAINIGVVSSVPGAPFQLAQSAGLPGAIAQAAGKFLYVLLPLTNSVAAFSIDPASGALTAVQGSSFATGNLPSALAADFSGTRLYVTNELDGTVSGFAIASSGALTAIPGSPFPAGGSPDGVMVDNLGHLYVTNNLSNNISGYSIAAATGALTPIPGSPFPAGTQPNSIAFSTVP